MKIGVLAVQGAFEEHEAALSQAIQETGHDGEVVEVRTPEQLAMVSGLIIPGGESTTISRLLRSSGIQEPLLQRAKAGELAVWGTCAGMILLAKTAVHDVAEKDIQLLGLIDGEVDRNAYGRQRESFEATAEIKGIGKFPTVYIRAPVYTTVSKEVEVLARDPKGIVAAKQGKIMATAFHPELTGDSRLHQKFLEMC